MALVGRVFVLISLLYCIPSISLLVLGILLPVHLGILVLVLVLVHL